MYHDLKLKQWNVDFVLEGFVLDEKHNILINMYKIDFNPSYITLTPYLLTTF